MSKTPLLQVVDDDVRAAAREILGSARYGSLAVLDPQSGHPLVSRVILATDQAGAPVILISRLSAHFAALERDPRASLLVGEPGRGDPLAHPRISIQTRARRITDTQERAVIRTGFLAAHPKAALYADFSDFAFWRLEVSCASFNGGFARAYVLAPEDMLLPPET